VGDDDVPASAMNRDADWFGRDHVLVIQAAANLDATPAYAEQLWRQAIHPERAALQLIALLVKERAEVTDDGTG